MVDGVHRPVVVVVVVLLQFFRFLVRHCTKETKYNAAL
jgi:hypothetical protein